MKNIGLAILFLMFTSIASAAGVLVVINKASQTMDVFFNNQPIAHWKVSTARSGYSTPSGMFYPQSLQKIHFSKKYNNSPMPYSIFFKNGYAIHGSYAVSSLGKKASHGCVRLSPSNAKILFGLVSSNPTTIRIK